MADELVEKLEELRAEIRTVDVNKASEIGNVLRLFAALHDAELEALGALLKAVSKLEGAAK